MKNLKAFLVLISFFLFCGAIRAQNNEMQSPGDSWSLGYSLIDELLPEGNTYKPVTLLSNIPVWTLKRLTIYAESQFTQAYSVVNLRTDFEFGINMGLSFDLLRSEKLRLNAAVGSGPHFITVETNRQSKGFIFSDNFELGASYNLKGISTAVLFKLRYRHISNAGLKEPNGGIDNFFVIAGLSTGF